MTSTHICDEFCVCPIHETPLFLNPNSGAHSCEDMDCVYAHGYESAVARPDPSVNYAEIRDWLGNLVRRHEWMEEEPDGLARGQSGPQGSDS